MGAPKWPPIVQARGATPPSDSPGPKCSERPGQAEALLGITRALCYASAFWIFASRLVRGTAPMIVSTICPPLTSSMVGIERIA